MNIECLPFRSCFYSLISGGLYESASTSIERLDKLLNVNGNGFYTIDDVKSLMKATHLGSIIAIGLREKDISYLASIRMSGINGCFISTPVKNKSNITLEEICEREWKEIETAWNTAQQIRAQGM